MAATSSLPVRWVCSRHPFPSLSTQRAKKLVEETIRTHHGVAGAIEARNPTAAHDAMYLHPVYNRNMIAEDAQTKGI